MTKQVCIRNAWKMFQAKDFQDAVKKEIERLVNSGAIDLEKEPVDSYAMPKVVLTVALENSSHDYAPLFEPYRKELKNLRKF